MKKASLLPLPFIRAPKIESARSTRQIADRLAIEFEIAVRHRLHILEKWTAIEHLPAEDDAPELMA